MAALRKPRSRLTKSERDLVAKLRAQRETIDLVATIVVAVAPELGCVVDAETLARNIHQALVPMRDGFSSEETAILMAASRREP